MKLKTSLQISAVFPVLLAVLVSVVLFLRARQTGSAEMDRGFFAGDMIFAGIIALAGVLMTFLTWSLGHDVAQRLKQLEDWAKTLSEGNLAAVDKTVKGNDEIGQLSRSLSEMAKKLAQSREAMAQEITEHKRVGDALRDSNTLLTGALEKLKRAQTQVVQQERMHVLEQVSRGVANDINNALMPILGVSEYLLRYPENLQDQALLKEQLTSIHEAALKVKEDMKKLFQFFGTGHHAERQRVNVNEIVAKAITIAQPKWKEASETGQKTISVKTRLGRVPVIMADAQGLLDSIVNLIMNAIDALARGGSITVATELVSEGLLIEVADTGVGMSNEVREKCIEPFFSTKEGEGTGMGLSVVSGVAKAHGGRLAIESFPNRGTKVQIILPSTPAAEEAKPQVGDRKFEGKLSILVIDDEMCSRTVASRVLAKEGHKVDMAEDGTSGLAKFESGNYGLVIVDRAMPDLSGDEVAVAIRKKSPATPVILLTGFGEAMLAEGAQLEGIDAILPKPVGAKELCEAVLTVAGRKMAANG